MPAHAPQEETRVPFDPADADSRAPALALLRHAVARLREAEADYADTMARLNASPAYEAGGGMATPASRQWDALQNSAYSQVIGARISVIETVLTAMGRVHGAFRPERILDEALPVSFELDGAHYVVSRPDKASRGVLDLLVIDANADFDSGQFGCGPTEAPGPDDEEEPGEQDEPAPAWVAPAGL